MHGARVAVAVAVGVTISSMLENSLPMHSVLHAGLGLTGLSRAITEYLVTEDVNSCLPYLTEEDIPDLDVRETLKQVN